MFFTKECSCGSFESIFAFSFSFVFSSPHVATFQRSGLPSLVVVPCPKKLHPSTINVTLLTNSFVHCPLSKFSSALSSTMKVLFMLPPCPFIRSEGFSMELLRRAEQMHKHFFHCFKGISRDIPRRESVLVSLSLWASLRSRATMNIVVKLSLNGNCPAVIGLLCDALLV